MFLSLNVYWNKSAVSKWILKLQKNSMKKKYYSVIFALVNRLAQLDDTNKECIENISIFTMWYKKKIRISLKYKRRSAQKSNFSKLTIKYFFLTNDIFLNATTFLSTFCWTIHDNIFEETLMILSIESTNPNRITLLLQILFFKEWHHLLKTKVFKFFMVFWFRYHYKNNH